MLIQNIEFRPGGLAVIFDDGTEAVGTFKVVNNIMVMDGLNSIEEQLLSAFISRMDETALLDPRLDICKLAAPTDDTSEPTSQDPDVANDLLQWSRADSITGVADGGTAVFWPAMVGEDGFATQVDVSDDFTGGGKWVDNAINGFPAVESPANSTQGTAWWDDWNALQIGDRPLIFFFVARLKFEQLSATSQLISDTNTASAVEGLNIGYQGGASGWRHGSWGKGLEITNNTFNIFGTGNGTFNDWGSSPVVANKSENVDDPVGFPDDDATYVRLATFALNGRQTFIFDNPNLSGVEITKLTMHTRIWRNAVGGNITTALIVVNGTRYLIGSSIAPNAWTDFEFDYTTNPDTGLAWTFADINGDGPNPLQEIGFRATGLDAGEEQRCTQAYMTVHYTTSNPILDVLTVSNYAPADTNWHVFTVQFLPATTRDHAFYDSATLQIVQNSATGVGVFPDSTEGMSIFRNRQTPASQWHGLLAEFRIYEGFMIDADRNAVIHALEERYNL